MVQFRPVNRHMYPESVISTWVPDTVILTTQWDTIFTTINHALLPTMTCSNTLKTTTHDKWGSTRNVNSAVTWDDWKFPNMQRCQMRTGYICSQSTLRITSPSGLMSVTVKSLSQVLSLPCYLIGWAGAIQKPCLNAMKILSFTVKCAAFHYAWK